MNSVAIALGSNLGDRRRHVESAVHALRHHLSLMAVSSWYETEPVGVGAQPQFLNGAVVGETALTARALLDTLMQIERASGRERPYTGAPRTLDLDVILYDGLIIDEPGLQVPHPRFRERLFVLAPLAEIAGDWIDPVTGQSIRTLLDQRNAK